MQKNLWYNDTWKGVFTFNESAAVQHNADYVVIPTE